VNFSLKAVLLLQNCESYITGFKLGLNPISVEVMSDFEDLLKDLMKELRKKGTLKSSDILAWGERRKLTPLTLYLLFEELKENREVKLSEEKELIDESLELYIPKKVEYVASSSSMREIPKERSNLKVRKSLRKTKLKRKKGVKNSSQVNLVNFLKEKEEVKGKTKDVSKPEASLPEDREVTQEQVIVIQEERAPSFDDPDLVKALDYLSKYWSVGEIRFIQDLKRLGVRNPREVIEKLLSHKLISRSKLGVINAEKKLLEVYKPRPTSITDIV